MKPNQIEVGDVLILKCSGTLFKVVNSPCLIAGKYECNVTHEVPDFTVWTKNAVRHHPSCLELDKNLESIAVICRKGEKIYP